MLIINEPSIFYSQKDEDVFFQWLESIPAIQKVLGTAKGLEIHYSGSFNEPSLRELIALLKRYDIDLKALKPLCNAKNQKWFKDKKKFWYQSVFGNSKKPLAGRKRN